MTSHQGQKRPCEAPFVAGKRSGADQRRIGHALLESVQLWIEQCARRNRALRAAAQALAENAYLAVMLAKQAAAIGNRELAARLEEEAGAEEHRTVQIL